MNLARVVGNVWATVKTPNLEGERLLLLQPLDFRTKEKKGGVIAAVDTVRAGSGDLVFYVTSREAGLALKDPFTPVDAATVGFIDRIDLASE